MPDKEQKQPAPRPADRDSEQRDFSTHEGEARDGEVLKASGARTPPSSDPDLKPGPINKAADLTEETREASVFSAPEPPQPTPPPPPTTDSDEG